MLREEAHYVQSAAKNNLATLLSSGFTAINRNTAQSPLARPVIRKLINHHSTQLWLFVTSVANARLYQVRLKAGDGDWQDGGTYSQARKITVPNLVPGTIYQVQVRALGGSTGYSEWSLGLSIMAT